MEKIMYNDNYGAMKAGYTGKKQSWLQSLYRRIISSKKLFGINNWNNNAVIIDTAYADNIPSDLSSIAMWIVRMGQGPKNYFNTDPRDTHFDSMVNKIYLNGNCAIGAYVVIDPRYYNAFKYNNIADMYMEWMIPMLDNKVSDTLKRKSVNFLALDFEIKYDWNKVQITDSNLFHDLRIVAEAAHKRWPNLPIGVYCNGDMLFTPKLCPSLLPWINANRDWLYFWGAKWYYYKLINYKSLKDYVAVKPSSTFEPLKVGIDGNEWDMLQYGGDNGTVPDITTNPYAKVTALDISFYNGNKEKLWSDIGFIPGVPVEPPPIDPPQPPPPSMTIEQRVARLETGARVHGWFL
jgi:hypothetical protein